MNCIAATLATHNRSLTIAAANCASGAKALLMAGLKAASGNKEQPDILLTLSL